VDIKTKSVHFYVQRNNPWNNAVGLIHFDLAPLNEGGAFNLSLRSFIVPVPGIYHFYLSAVKYRLSGKHLQIRLQVNGKGTGISAENGQGGSAGDVVSLSASLRLAAGDRVNLYLVNGGLYDDHAQYTHFTGWLVEEELGRS